MSRIVVTALVAAALAGAPSGARAATQEVNAQFAEFGPSQLDVLAGEPVEWTNVSDRTHTVTSDTDAFASGDLAPGERFSVQLDDVGDYAYHCTVHSGMVGELDVRRVILGPLPTAAIPVGDRVELTGRTADPSQPVRIERSTGGTDFAPVAGATPAADGTWRTTVTAVTTADYRASSGPDASRSRRLLVSDRRVLVHATRAGVAITVTPSVPYARIVLQIDLRERFGWWPAVSARLNYLSQADVAVRRPARVRVVLVDKDGWTPLATSRVVVVGHSRGAP